MKKLDKAFEGVKDETTFLTFVKALTADRTPHEGKSTDEIGFVDDWANNSIADFLEAATAWAEDTNFGAKLGKESATNPWKQFAAFLYAGKHYE